MAFLRSILLSQKAEDNIAQLMKFGFYKSDLIDFCIFNGYSLPIKPDEIIINKHKGNLVLRTVVMPSEYAHYLDNKAIEHQCSVETLTTYFIDLGLSLLLKHTKNEASLKPLKKLIKAHAKTRQSVKQDFRSSGGSHLTTISKFMRGL